MQTPELLSEIEDAIQRLSPEELRAFRRWFAEYDAQQWDAEFERDVAEAVRLATPDCGTKAGNP
jgi:hypothetical protein